MSRYPENVLRIARMLRRIAEERGDPLDDNVTDDELIDFFLGSFHLSDTELASLKLQ